MASERTALGYASFCDGNTCPCEKGDFSVDFLDFHCVNQVFLRLGNEKLGVLV